MKIGNRCVMEKTHMVLLLVLVCSIMLFAAGCTTVRGVELHIVDDETGEPIPNICVNYSLSKWKSRFPEFEEIIVKPKKFFTNEKGIVYIKKSYNFTLGWFRFVGGENFYINIDIDDKYVERRVGKNYYFTFYFLDDWNTGRRDDRIFFPNQEYYPVFIYNSYRDLDSRYVIKQKSLNFKEREEDERTKSDLKEKEDIVMTIGLKRKKDSIIDVKPKD